MTAVKPDSSLTISFSTWMTDMPTRPATPKGTPARPWAEFPQTADGAFQYFCSLLGEPYQGAKHDERWFALFDEAAQGKDPDQFTPEDVLRLFQAIRDGMAK